MCDKTIPQDSAAMSPASAGSVSDDLTVAYFAGVEAGKKLAALLLTHTERRAIRVARDAYADDDGNAECESIAAVLSGLLERTK
jgi:hypothetical protein